MKTENKRIWAETLICSPHSDAEDSAAVKFVLHKKFPSHAAVFENLLQFHNIGDYDDPIRFPWVVAGNPPIRLHMEATETKQVKFLF